MNCNFSVCAEARRSVQAVFWIGSSIDVCPLVLTLIIGYITIILARAASLHKDIAIPLTSMLESKHDCTSAAHVISALARKSHDVCLAIFRTEAPSLLMNMLCDADDSAAAAVEALAAIMHSGVF